MSLTCWLVDRLCCTELGRCGAGGGRTDRHRQMDVAGRAWPGRAGGSVLPHHIIASRHSHITVTYMNGDTHPHSPTFTPSPSFLAFSRCLICLAFLCSSVSLLTYPCRAMHGCV